MKQLILLFALIMAASPVRAVSFDDIIDQVRVDLHDNGSSDTYRYPQADMVRAANFIHSEICREAKIPQASYSTTTWNTLNVYYNQDPTDITTSTTSLATSPFGGQSQYQSYGNILVTGIKAMLTGQGYDLYYAMLSNLSETVKANYDRFIREPDRRSY